MTIAILLAAAAAAASPWCAPPVAASSTGLIGGRRDTLGFCPVRGVCGGGRGRWAPSSPRGRGRLGAGALPARGGSGFFRRDGRSVGYLGDGCVVGSRSRISASRSADDGASSSVGRVGAAEEEEFDWTPETRSIALPALAGMMTDPLLSLVDTLFVGRLGSNIGKGGGSSSSVPLAALGACTSIFHLAFHCFRATTQSTASLVAGASARDARWTEGEDGDDVEGAATAEPDGSEASLVAEASIQQAVVTGGIVAAFLLILGPRCLLAMGVPDPSSPVGSVGPPELYPSALTYLRNRAVAAPAAVALAASEGIFRGRGDATTPLRISTIVALLNLVLDPFCMFGGKGRGLGLGMGIRGAAVATAFSQICGALLALRWLDQAGMLRRWKGSLSRFSWRKPKSGSLTQRASLRQRKRSVAMAILRANAAMTAKQGSLLLAWAYATARATRMGHVAVASHQMALSIWMVVSLALEGPGVAAQVLMAREYEGLKTSGKDGAAPSVKERGRRAVWSLSRYMLVLSVVQGLVASLAILGLRAWAPGAILTRDPSVRLELLALLPHVAAQMTLVSATLVAEALAVGGGRFRWLAGGTALSSVAAVARLRGAQDLAGIWSGGIVALFLGRLVTALLAVMDMNALFRIKDRDSTKNLKGNQQ